MDEMKGLHIIRSLRKKWISWSLLSDLILSVSISILFSIVTNKFFGISAWWGIALFILTFGFLLFIHRAWKTTNTGIAQLLNQHYPTLEESSTLLLKPVSSLNTLEALQSQQTEDALSAISTPLQISRKIISPLYILVAVLLTGFVIYKLPFQYHPRSSVQNNIDSTNTEKPEKILPQISGAVITIKPPLYTSKPEREQNKFNLLIEDGSSVNWRLKTNLPVSSIKFVFNDSLSISMHATDESHQSWQTDKLLPVSGFYQINIDSNLSELYKVETIADKPPLVHVQSPKQYTIIDFGEPQQVLTRVEMSDDYGISDASITATIASGSGEAVKFKEQTIALPNFIAGRTQYDLQKLLLLPSFGMQPGDELYFYVKAKDNHDQETRSDIFIVQLPDTAQLMSVDGLMNGINLKPEYFRSERQIIIETLQLLKDKDTISTESFKNRSNNLGIDQKLLRLRYGKFLGEEDESTLFPGEKGDDLSDPANFSNADKVRDAFTDKHDNAEDATFLDPAVKEQLKATLTEMWKAELQLRTFKPQDALPFEYKALRLLKDLQQKSRAYVAKTNYKTTPLDLQKRMTGDLSKISTPILEKDIKQGDDPQNAVRTALGILEKIKLTNNTKDISQDELRQANLRLNEKAIQHPALYISSVQALRKIINDWNAGNPINKNDIEIAENGLQRLLSDPELLPSAERNNVNDLSKQYFLNLQKKQP